MRPSFVLTVGKGVAWSYLAFISGRAITFLSTIVLARILAPDAFGLMAIALLMIRYLDAINDAGVGAALVQQQDLPVRTAGVAFSVAAASGSALTVLLFISAPELAAFFDQPELTDLLRFLSPIFVIAAFSNVQSHWLQKNFRFGARVIPETAKAVAKAATAISLAFAGYGVWSLAVGQMVGQIAAALIYLSISDLVLRLLFDRDIAIRLISFGAQISLVTLIGVFSKSLDQLVIGRVLDPADLGYYVLGAMVPELVIASICVTASRVFFSAFSRAQGRPRLLRAGYLASLKYVSMLTLPAGVGLALTAGDFVNVAYSGVWAASIPVIWILSINAAVQSLSFNAGDVFKAIGRPRLLVQLSIFNIVISTPMLVTGARYGIAGVAVAQFLGNLVVIGVTIAIARRLIGFSGRQYLQAIGRPTMATAVMASGCAIVLILTPELTSFARLPLTIATGVLIYATAIWRLDREALLAILTLRKQTKKAH